MDIDIAQLHGVLPIYKPKGMVSKDVSRVLQKHIHRKLKIGHVGTLDPMAEGVLPILVGKATKLQNYLLNLPKAYRFKTTYGYLTDTLDDDGTIIKSQDVLEVPNEEAIRNALDRYTGKIEQTPPLYSAVKYKGKPLYQYAREGLMDSVPLEELKREVEIYSLELHESYSKGFSGDVLCSKGTYIRTLIYDICNDLNVLGTMSYLQRRLTAGIEVTDAIALEKVIESPELFASFLLPIEKIKFDIPMWRCNHEPTRQKLMHGQVVALPNRHWAEGFLSQIQGVNAEHRIDTFILMSDDAKIFGIGQMLDVASDSIKFKMVRGI